MFSKEPFLFRACTERPQQQYPRNNDPSGGTYDEQDLDVSKKIRELTHEEREKALYDLHGVSDAVEETSELIAQKLEELDMELEKIEATYVIVAMQQSMEYVKKSRLMFLRADRFDVKKAAKRMALFFEMKRNAFGESKLTKDIGWDDLSEGEHQCLKEGSIQLMPQRDRAGRAVFFRIGLLNLREDTMTQIRLSVFVLMRAAKDEEIQKHGAVFVQYSVGITRFKVDTTTTLMHLQTAIPIRKVASHFCYDNQLLRPAAQLMEFIMSKTEARDICSFRAHFGSDMECKYALMTFGIIKDFIPAASSGDFKLIFHHQWLKQIEMDNSIGSGHPDVTSEIIVAGPMDIVLGRGRHAEQSPGNLRFKHLLWEYQERYDNAKRPKTKIIQTVLNDLKESGCRFIRREGLHWIEISDATARGKIAHAFRNLRAGVNSSNVSKARRNKREREENPVNESRENIDMHKSLRDQEG